MSTDDDIILPDAFQREDAREAFCESDDAESDSDSKSFYTTIDVDSDGETDKTDIDTTVNNDTGRHTPPALDHFEGMYRLLDLITEQGSGGTFDKVIIDQASLEAFINDISPGAYKSLTKVDFKKLDQWNINPVGVYGSSEEIMRFLVSLGAVPPERVDNMKSIRSGLYLVKPHDDLAKYYIFYWPEPTTWRDDAIASVVRNRVTFMRYLTKMTDQTLCLLSDEEAHALVWNVENINDIEEEDEDDDENFRRLFTFEVSKTQDQEENVTSAPGFTRYCDAITKTKIAHDTPQAFDTFLPRLLCGETTQAFYALTYKPASTITETFQETLPLTRLQYMLQQPGVSFSTEASDDTIEMAIGNGLGALHVQEIEAWRGRNCTSEQVNSGMATEAFRQQEESLQADPENLAVTRRAMFKLIKDRYPTLDFGSFDEAPVSSERTRELDEKFTWYLRTYPQFKFIWDGLSNDKKNLNVTTKEFTTLETRILKVKAYIEECNSPDCNVVDRLLKGEHVEETKRSIWARVPEVIGWKRQSVTPAARTMDCVEFIACLPDLYTKEVRLRDAISEATSLAQLHFQAVISTCGDSLATVLLEQQVQHILQDVHLAQNERLEGARLQSRQQLIVDISNKQLPTTRLTSLSIEAKGRRKKDICFIMCGERTMETEPMLECRVHPFSYSQHDLQDLSRDPAFVPSPDINARRAFNLHLPINSSILYFHALENDMFLLVLEQADGAMIYLESASTMDNAIRNKHPKKDFHYTRVGSSLIFAYDETKRTLAVCNRTELVLHVFTFDEMFKNLAGLGGTRRLDRWYEQVMPWSHACFLPGGEAILLVDYGANARIFSLESEMFRPAAITLDRVPLDVFASPDGACMFLTYREPGTGAILVHTYHWSAFGFSEPLIHVAPAALSGSLLLTSIGSRTSVHLIGLDLESRSVVSSIFHITTKATEFQFAERGGRKLITGQRCITANNCLLECHGDVWTRFPVNAPIQCRISGDVSPRRLIFASTCNHANFAPHFSALVQSFEASTRKPTKVKMKGTFRDVLREIKVNAISHEGVMTELLELSSSEFPLGEWLVKLVCLIPIHIAVARNNCFLPLKDGVLSTEWEKSLSGAEVSKIVNSVTLGWYESIFQSYMAQKPVKVVSSMGEQSVGKSYCLNHLVDSSFAGSAMRTTEGVWLSCTPTVDALIVALDFEGVHSPERTAQEDTLLVLFNTAISNLVLFRNNFALSRNITGLFQSFQSSSTVLDPAANPSLFQSTLVIIIKDVAEHDTEDIAREFESKFNHIVKTEKSFNFITRLHNGHLSILPWPVIESRDFYSLFGKMKKELSKQIVTHDAAGEFLLTLKTMMAKLWANDWGAISQTLVAHRAQHLLALLPSAMMYRSTELPPEEEPLKNFDTDEAIPLGVDVHPPLHFWLDQSCTPDDCESVLSNLCQTWPEHHTRENTIDSDWIRDLAAYLQNVVDQRIKLVEAWIHSNMARFKAKHDSITELGREFDRLQVDLRTGVQLCQLKCASCNLSCTMNMRHSPDVLHDCGTTHICRKTCEYDHGDSTKGCGYPAGHSGMHVCHVDAHLCGQPCKLEGKVGCMNDCTQNVAHEGEHLCSSKEHLCGEPCALQSAGSGNHTCERTCTHASNEMHDVHICDNRLCPISCDLCKRLCSTTDHLHGLKHDTIHLCGQEHSCKALCAASGVCEIDTAPQSVSATFTGRHETFEYTKYSQVAKRLKCAVIIPAGQKDHVGSHIHSTDDNPFHFCEAQCKWCGYWCTLPLGHSQTLHNTSHGSMSRTRWAIEPESTLEVNGHKYGADDDGAPMMCNLFCSDMGRHAHMDFCRAEDPHRCGEAEVEHVRGGTRFNPEPERSKDWVSHSLLWRRSGFEDPYSREDRDNFAKCDTMCPDLEHEGGAASYCTLPLFHAVPTSRELGGVGAGYLSQDGHLFACDEPLKQQAYHIIFVIDRSGSMDSTDRVPLRNTPVSTKLQRQVNNRLGAAYSALYSFCTARQNLDAGAARDQRRDAYSVILFNNAASIAIANDFTQDTDAMLDALLQYPPAGGTDFTVAVDMARHAMISYWSADRSPVVLFLSDGESHLPTRPLESLTEAAIQHGIPLSLQTVAFGSEHDSTVLRSMASQALKAQNRGRASLGSSITTIDSSYSQAIDTIRLNDTFLSIAESLRKPRGALMRG